jgi:hypothetical protein
VVEGHDLHRLGVVVPALGVRAADQGAWLEWREAVELLGSVTAASGDHDIVKTLQDNWPDGADWLTCDFENDGSTTICYWRNNEEDRSHRRDGARGADSVQARPARRTRSTAWRDTCYEVSRWVPIVCGTILLLWLLSDLIRG